MTLDYATKKSSSMDGESPCVNKHHAPSTSHTIPSACIASLVQLTERPAKSHPLPSSPPLPFPSPAPIMLPPLPFPTATPPHPPQNHLSPIPPPAHPINPSSPPSPPPSPPPQPSQSSPATAETTHPPHSHVPAPEPPPRPGPYHSHHEETSRASPLLVLRVGFEECRVELVH